MPIYPCWHNLIFLCTNDEQRMEEEVCIISWPPWSLFRGFKASIAFWSCLPSNTDQVSPTNILPAMFFNVWFDGIHILVEWCESIWVSFYHFIYVIYITFETVNVVFGFIKLKKHTDFIIFSTSYKSLSSMYIV